MHLSGSTESYTYAIDDSFMKFTKLFKLQSHYTFDVYHNKTIMMKIFYTYLHSYSAKSKLARYRLKFDTNGIV